MESRINLRSSGMNRHAESCKAAAPFYKPHQRVWYADTFQRLRKNKLIRL